MSCEKIVLIIDPKRRVFPQGTKPYGSKMEIHGFNGLLWPLKNT